MSSHTYPVIESRLSAVRMAPYLAAAGGDQNATLELYAWNLQISAAFFVDLSTAEVVLRNAIDGALRAKYQRKPDSPSWFDQATLNKSGSEHLASATARAEAAGHVAHDDVIAQLSFGFWRSLFTKYYQATLWPVMRPVFLDDPKRQSASREGIFHIVDELGYVRNRIAHHETLFRRDLDKQHHALLNLTGSICQETRSWVESNSAVADLLATKPMIR
jgi:hypothetical protein